MDILTLENYISRSKARNDKPTFKGLKEYHKKNRLKSRCSYKLLKYRYNFIGLNIDYRIGEKVGYYVEDKKGNLKYYFKNKDQAEQKIVELIENLKVN